MLLIATLPACGVLFSADSEGTEVFEDLTLEGDFEPGSTIEVVLEVSEAYPLPLAISCRYENTDVTDDEERVAFNERTESVYETVLAATTSGEPGDEDTPTRVHAFDFTVEEPGDYFIACFTVASPLNGIGQGFTIEDVAGAE